MKAKFSIILYVLLLSFSANLMAQSSSSQKKGSDSDTTEDPCIIEERSTTKWTIDPITGSVIPSRLDTAFLNFYRTDIEDSYTTAYNYLGNFGTPGESRIFFAREDRPDFLFMKAYDRFNITPSNIDFLNTQIPYTEVGYLSGGSKQNAEDRFRVNFAGNINKRFGLGSTLDYVYTRGFYNFQGVNTLNWQIKSYYMGERYQIQGYADLSRFGNQENGGIQDRAYILAPEATNPNLSDPENIPTNLVNAWNRTNHKQVFFNQKYNLGYTRKFLKNEGDSIETEEFVTASTIFHNFDLTYNKRRFYNETGANYTPDYFQNTYYSDVLTDDSTSFLSVKNTLGITMNEGFTKWAKFGLAAYATFDYQRYTLMEDSANLGTFARDFTTPILKVGGQINKRQGQIFKYNAQGEFTISGYNIGDIDVRGDIQTQIPVKGDSIIVRANGYYKLQTPNYYYNNYFSNHFRWKNDFNKEMRTRIYGELEYTKTRTRLGAGVENMTDYIYFNREALPTQDNGNIQIIQARLEQDFKVGILHWNNDLVFQHSSNQTVLPLPKFSAYSQLFINFTIAGVLHTQLGVDCTYNTRYYAPTYQPATQMFHLQDMAKTGGYPLMNAYANAKLKRIRFYVMMYHVNKGLFGGNDYFSSPLYPLNPRFFKFGVSVEFGN